MEAQGLVTKSELIIDEDTVKYTDKFFVELHELLADTKNEAEQTAPSELGSTAFNPLNSLITFLLLSYSQNKWSRIRYSVPISVATLFIYK